jgi:uncharacterized small protein (DUF1192 family)
MSARHITDERLAELTRLVSAAAPGPWGYGRALCCDGMGWVEGPTRTVCSFDKESTHVHAVNAVDAEFIAAARQAVPELVAEVRRLRADLAREKTLRDAAERTVYAAAERVAKDAKRLKR